MKKLLHGLIPAVALLPILSIAGTYIFNIYDTNLLQLATPVLSGLIAVAIVFLGDKSNDAIYAMGVFCISLTMVLRASLVSPFLVGFDINSESYFAGRVLVESKWDASSPENYNSVLSINVLTPMISLVSGINILWILKLIYSILLATSTLVLFLAYKKQTSNKTAFLASLLVSSIYSYYGEISGVGKQIIAQYFLTLIILFLSSERNTALVSRKGAVLFVFFTLGLVTSHYGLSYYFLLYLSLIIPALIFLWRKGKRQAYLKPAVVLLYTLEVVVWYLYMARGVTFQAIVDLGNRVINGLKEDLLNPSAVDPLRVAIGSSESVWRMTTKVLNASAIFLSMIGFVCVLLRLKKWRFRRDYILICTGTFVVAAMSLVVPYFAPLGIGRLQVLVLITLAPFSIAGISSINRVMRLVWRSLRKSNLPLRSELKFSLRLQSLLIFSILVFNSAVVYQMVGDKPTSLTLDKNATGARFTIQDQVASDWLVSSLEPSQYWHVDADLFGSVVFYRYGPVFSYHGIEMEQLESNKTLRLRLISRESIIYLTSFNIKNEIVYPFLPRGGTPRASWEWLYVDLQVLKVGNKNRIYDSGEVNIYAEGRLKSVPG
ncbi:MAG: DUF2206 domain-containing protein [Candidatus Bathyarchaeota archaeon]|nr:DUF2206 domain-containing protein [Candidatus Bathyarchaeota archaeon]